MRLVLDLQAAQSSNRLRGIGRYSLGLAKALARAANHHEVWLALNHRFDDTVEFLRFEFDGLIPQEHIRVFEAPSNLEPNGGPDFRRERISELLREAFLSDLRPDLVHIFSLFEEDVETVTSIGAFEQFGKTSVTLHDLIPLAAPDVYLKDPLKHKRYFRKIEDLKKADLILTASAWSRREAIERLRISEERIVTVSAGLADFFRPLSLNSETSSILLGRYGITKKFLLGIHGIGSNKNIHGLIEAFALLNSEVRCDYQLVLVGCLEHRHREKLGELASKFGLETDQLVVLGFASDEELVMLYNLCHLFVFPSNQEGFGLPPLEAMACGAPVIAANATSIPDVVGWADALFDPREPESISEKMAFALTVPHFRESLREYGLRQARKFSWEQTARRAWEAFERIAPTPKPSAAPTVFLGKRRRLAYVSPLPPLRTGVADYSAELLPALSQYYEIDVVADQRTVSDPWITHNLPVRDSAWFDLHASEFDRILYHFGNSNFHAYMFDLLRRHPGLVVLHDFYLGNSLHAWYAAMERDFPFTNLLYQAHGYEALALYRVEGSAAVARRLPLSLSVLAQALGAIVHSRYAQRLAGLWYRMAEEALTVIPHLRAAPKTLDRISARQRLGVKDDELVICSFGFLGRPKCNHRLVDSWTLSRAGRDPKCRLVMVGLGSEEDVQTFTEILVNAGTGDRFQVTGFVEQSLYRDYLSAADIAVQLRAESRGENSGTILDCLAHGIPTITNAHASMAELPQGTTLMLPDTFSDRQLTDAIDDLALDPEKRRRLGNAGREYTLASLSPHRVAGYFHQEMEALMQQSARLREARLLESVAKAVPGHSQIQSNAKIPLDEVATAIHANRPALRSKQLLIDITILLSESSETDLKTMVDALWWRFLTSPPAGFRIEPIWCAHGKYRYARRYAVGRIASLPLGLEDDPVEAAVEDIFLGFESPSETNSYPKDLDAWKGRGVGIYYYIGDKDRPNPSDFSADGTLKIDEAGLKMLLRVAKGIICGSPAVADKLVTWSKECACPRRRTVRIESISHGAQDVIDFILRNSHSLDSPSEDLDVAALLRKKIDFLARPLQFDHGYGPGQSKSFAHYLTEGWSSEEPWGIWTEGKLAGFQFHCLADAGKKCFLELDGMAFLHPPLHPSLTVTASVNGKIVDSQIFNEKHRASIWELPLTSGLCVVHLRIEHPRSPSECCQSDDQRKIGFGLKKMTLVQR
ncbi:MAG: glycosyltransferase [Verrucomicrobiota bacterium]|nr:glycosyltransferase [Verrucomicrobiota bacterium]